MRTFLATTETYRLEECVDGASRELAARAGWAEEVEFVDAVAPVGLAGYLAHPENCVAECPASATPQPRTSTARLDERVGGPYERLL